tara:strand:- start:30189 stop:30467 length:279 start_codon:yes stop_codon:yes gene_type:complete
MSSSGIIDDPKNLEKKFLNLGKKQFMGAVAYLFSYLTVWYGTVLILSDYDSDGWFTAPRKQQWVGLGFQIIIGILVWLQVCFTLQGDSKKQG